MHDAPPDLSSGAPLLIREGSDVTLLVAGPIVTQAIEVADTLASEGLSVRVADLSGDQAAQRRGDP